MVRMSRLSSFAERWLSTPLWPAVAQQDLATKAYFGHQLSFKLCVYMDIDPLRT